MQTIFFGKNLIELEEVNSTNDYASKLIQLNKPGEGTVILAQHQYSGRGQRGTSWESEEGKNLIFSIILYPEFIQPQKIFLLNKAISLGVYDFAKSILKKNVSVKWPNDIFYKDKKLGGILIENSLRTSFVLSTIVGIGLNVNQYTFQKYNPNPTSLRRIQKKEFDLKNCLENLLSFLEIRYLQLKAGKLKLLDEDYLHSLYLLNQWHYFEISGRKVKLKITGIGKEGKLETENVKREKLNFSFKEINFRATL